MAFVVKAERNLDMRAASTSEQLGPGSYIGHTQYQTNQSTAPFWSKGQRPSIFDETNLIPGPGAYNINKLPEGQKVVLQSGSSEVQVLEIPKQQSVFRSVSKRFNEKSPEIPGPGAYEDPKQMSQQIKPVRNVFRQSSETIINHLMKINKYQSIPSIPCNEQIYGYTEKDNNQLELNKSPEQKHSGLKIDSVGPGQYNTLQSKVPKGVVWHNSKVPKLSSTTKEQDLGPGMYNTESQAVPLYKLKPSCEFVSKSQRMFDIKKGNISQEFIKDRLKRTQKNFLGGEDEESEEIEFIDDQTPGPGHYFTANSTTVSNQSRLSRYKSDQSFAFGSQEQRFKDTMKQYNIGPGDYELKKQQQLSMQFKHPPFQSSNTRFQVPAIETAPGPQYYNIKLGLNEKLKNQLKRSPLGNFGINQQRFKSSDFKTDGPGPGGYQQQLSQEKDPDMPLETTGNFKSKSIRDPFQVKRDMIPPPGAYSLDQLSIEKFTRVEREEDPDLEPKRVPFLSSVPRVFEGAQKIVEVNEDDEIKTPQKDINSMFMKKPNKNAPFDSRQPRFNYNKTEKVKIPGPGDYHDTKSNPWDKKTFNILFAGMS